MEKLKRYEVGKNSNGYILCNTDDWFDDWFEIEEALVCASSDVSELEAENQKLKMALGGAYDAHKLEQEMTNQLRERIAELERDIQAMLDDPGSLV